MEENTQPDLLVRNLEDRPYGCPDSGSFDPLYTNNPAHVFDTMTSSGYTRHHVFESVCAQWTRKRAWDWGIVPFGPDVPVPCPGMRQGRMLHCSSVYNVFRKGVTRDQVVLTGP